MDKILLTSENIGTAPILSNPIEKTTETLSCAKNGNPVMSLVHLGFNVLLSSLSLEHMSGDELLTYIKGSVLATMTVIAAEKNELTTTDTSEMPENAHHVGMLNPKQLVKKINSLIYRNHAANAA